MVHREVGAVLIPVSEEIMAEVGASLAFSAWLHVLARPEVFQTLNRSPSPSHVINLLDVYLPYAGKRSASAEERGDASGARLGDLMSRMRALLESWSPATLPGELVETARALLVADARHTVLDWTKGPDLPIGVSVDQILTWPSDEPSG